MVDIRFFPFCQRCLGLAEVLFSPFLHFMSSLTFCSVALYISLHLAISFFPLLPFSFCLLRPPPPPPTACLPPSSPLPAESPYLSAVCLTYLSLLWNIKESAASSPEGSPRLLLTTHTYTLNLNHDVSWKLSAAVHFGQTAHFLLFLVDWRTPSGNCRCLYAVRETADT